MDRSICANIALIRIRPKPALMLLFAIFLAGNVLAAVAPSYPIMVVARVVTGFSSGPFPCCSSRTARPP
ncbi:hypothetical protein [Streptosporangium saharense]|uniref:hypothetical protein n=1 Tax=Streptosporangium saharense TaxID=1706840 RepID=UPI00332FAD67